MSDLSKKMRQVKNLKNSKDLQHLINEAYRIFKNPVILYDADWKILAQAEGVVTDDPLWNNHIGEGTVNSNIKTFINAGFIEPMIGPNKAVILSSAQIKYDRIFGKVFDHDHNLMAGMSVVASDKPFGEGDLVITEAVCKILSNEILKIPYYQNYAQDKLGACINTLIDREITDINEKLYISGYVEMVYNGLRSNLYLAAADISQCNPERAKLGHYMDLFKRIQPAFKYSVYSDYIIIIMSTDEEVFYPKRYFYRLNKLFEQDNIKIGISGRFENLFELRKHYIEAVYALKSGLKTEGSQRIFLHNLKKDST